MSEKKREREREKKKKKKIRFRISRRRANRTEEEFIRQINYLKKE